MNRLLHPHSVHSNSPGFESLRLLFLMQGVAVRVSSEVLARIDNEDTLGNVDAISLGEGSSQFSKNSSIEKHSINLDSTPGFKYFRLPSRCSGHLMESLKARFEKSVESVSPIPNPLSLKQIPRGWEFWGKVGNQPTSVAGKTQNAAGGLSVALTGAENCRKM